MHYPNDQSGLVTCQDFLFTLLGVSAHAFRHYFHPRRVQSPEITEAIRLSLVGGVDTDSGPLQVRMNSNFQRVLHVGLEGLTL